MPARRGVSAATVANNMLRPFTGIRFGLMVGIGGGIPDSKGRVDIRLSDAVVSQPDVPMSAGALSIADRLVLRGSNSRK